MTLAEVEECIGGGGPTTPLERATVWAAMAAAPRPEDATPDKIRTIARLALADLAPSSCDYDPDWEYLAPVAAAALRLCHEWLTASEPTDTALAAVVLGWREVVGSAWAARLAEGEPAAAEVLAALWGWGHD